MKKEVSTYLKLNELSEEIFIEYCQLQKKNKEILKDLKEKLKLKEDELWRDWCSTEKMARSVFLETVRLLHSSGLSRNQIKEKLKSSYQEVDLAIRYDNGKPASAETRKKVKIRDKFTCQYCNKKETKSRRIIVHHVKGGSHKLSNLISLCDKCHKGVHKGKVKI